MNVHSVLALAVCPLLLAARSPQEPPGVQAHWTFDEGSGKTAADASGSGFKGHLRDGAGWAEGMLGGSLRLDGVNDWVDLGTNVALLRASAGMSATGWLNVGLPPADGALADLLFLSTGSDRATPRIVFALRGDGAASDLFLGVRSTDVEAQHSLVADANLPAGQWVHVAATADLTSGVMNLYVNGVLKATLAVPFASAAFSDADSRTGAIGAENRGGANLFNGRLDDLRVYGRALPPAEIAALAGPGRPAAPTLQTAHGGDARVDLAWTAVAGALSYTVKRRLTTSDPFAVIANVAGTAHADLGLTNGTTYRYAVSAVNGLGEGPDSNELTATPTPDPPPAPPAITGPSGAVNTGSPAVTGTSGAAALTIALFVNGAPAGTATSGPVGGWSLVPSFAIPEGNHVLTATASDGVQTSAPSLPVSLTVDMTPPAITSPFPAPLSTVITASPTLSATWSDSGSGVETAAAQIVLDGIVVPGASIQPTGFSLAVAGLAAGPHAVTATIADAAGNSTGLSWSFTVVLPPPAPSITSPASGANLGTGTPTVTGTSSESGLAITLFADDTPIGTATSGAAGAWAITPASPLPDGSHTLSATAANAAGSSVPSLGVPVTIDTLPPTLAALTPSGGIFLNAASITLSADLSDAGSGIDPDSVLLALNGIVLTPTLTSLGGGAVRVSSTPPLGEGLHGFTVQVSDLAGRGPASASASFGVDRTPPLAAIATPAEGEALPNASISFSGSVSDGLAGVALAGIRLFLNGADATSAVSRTQGPGGDWTVAGTLAGMEGANQIELRATDRAGNTASDTVGFTVPAGGLSLTSVSPNRVGPQSLIRLAGAGLTSASGPTKVVLSGIEVTQFVTASSTAIDLRVPQNAVSGLVWVEVGGEVSNALSIEVVLAFSSDAIEALTIFDAQGYALCSMNDASVQLDPLVGPDGAQSLASAVGATLVGYVPGANNYLFRFPTTSLTDLVAALADLSGRPGVLRARPRLGLQPQMRTQDEPPEILFSRYERAVSEGRTGFWHFDRIQAPGAWQMLKKSSLQPGGVRIGLYDSGLETMHYEFRTNPLLTGKMLRIAGDGSEGPWTFGDRDSGHGTSMAGLMLGASDGDGISGVVTPPLEGKTADVRLYVKYYGVTPSTAARVYLWADELMGFVHQCAARNVKVVNVSMGIGVNEAYAQIGRFLVGLSNAEALAFITSWATEEIMVFRDAVRLHPSVLVVVCAGNENQNLLSDYFLYGSINTFGGALPNLIVVGGIQYDDNRWDWVPPGFSARRGSNYADPPNYLGDPVIDLAAPAGRLLVPTTSADGASQLLSFQEPFGGDDGTWYKYGDGTSGATALVSGAASLLFCYDASLTPAQAKRLLIDYAHRVRVDLPGGGKVDWDTLKLANSVRGLMLKKGISDDSIPEWSFLYSPSGTDTQFGIAKVNKIRWNPELRKYLAPDSQIILEPMQWFSVGPQGDRLLAPFFLPPNHDRTELRCFELPNTAAFEVFHTSNAPKVVCGTTEYHVNLHSFPLALGNLEAVFTSMQDFVCDDRSTHELWRRSRTGTSAALTNIQKDTLLKGFLFGSPGGLTDLGDTFRFEFATATQDNRWVLFCNQDFTDEGRLFLLPIGTDGKTPTPTSLGIKTDSAEHRFLMASLDRSALEDVSQPVVSPDGTRFVYIDRETRDVKIGYFFWDVTPLKPLVKPYHITKVHKLPATCDPLFDRVSWSPDGSHLVFSEAGTSSKKYTITAASGEYSDPDDVRPQKQLLLEIPGSGGSSQVLQWVWPN